MAKSCFLGRKEDGPDGFQKYWLAKNFPEENYSTRCSGGGSLIIWGGGFSSSGKFKLQFVSGRQKNRLFEDPKWFISRTEGRRLCGEKWIFQQDNAAIHNASIRT